MCRSRHCQFYGIDRKGNLQVTFNSASMCSELWPIESTYGGCVWQYMTVYSVNEDWITLCVTDHLFKIFFLGWEIPLWFMNRQTERLLNTTIFSQYVSLFLPFQKAIVRHGHKILRENKCFINKTLLLTRQVMYV